MAISFFERVKALSKARFSFAILLADLLISDIEVVENSRQKKTKKSGMKSVPILEKSEIDIFPNILTGLTCHPLLPYDMNASFCIIGHIVCNFT